MLQKQHKVFDRRSYVAMQHKEPYGVISSQRSLCCCATQDLFPTIDLVLASSCASSWRQQPVEEN